MGSKGGGVQQVNPGGFPEWMKPFAVDFMSMFGQNINTGQNAFPTPYSGMAGMQFPMGSVIPNSNGLQDMGMSNPYSPPRPPQYAPSTPVPTGPTQPAQPMPQPGIPAQPIMPVQPGHPFQPSIPAGNMSMLSSGMSGLNLGGMSAAVQPQGDTKTFRQAAMPATAAAVPATQYAPAEMIPIQPTSGTVTNPVAAATQGPMNSMWDYAGLLGQQMPGLLGAMGDVASGKLAPGAQNVMDYALQETMNKVTSAYANPYRSQIGGEIAREFSNSAGNIALQQTALLPQIGQLANQGLTGALSSIYGMGMGSVQNSLGNFWQPSQQISNWFGVAPYESPAYVAG